PDPAGGSRSIRVRRIRQQCEAHHASCRHALEEIGSAEDAFAARNQQLGGRLRIDAPAAWGRQFLMPILSGVAKAHPGLTLTLSLNDRIIDLSEEGGELAILFASGYP
ncbi:MAG: LysR family transcriptional regulator, partial [Alphaproteobacteria bacterium]